MNDLVFVETVLNADGVPTLMQGGAASATILISDGFSGTDGTSINGRTPDTVGSATWAEVFAPAPVIDTNQIKAGAAAASAAHISCGVADFTVTVDYTYRGENFNGILVRSSDSSNYYRIYHDTGNWTFQKRAAGSNSTLATVAQTLTSGVTYTLKVVCSGTTLAFYVDNVLKSEQTGQTFNQTATRAGVLLSNSSGTVSRFDNFKITNP